MNLQIVSFMQQKKETPGKHDLFVWTQSFILLNIILGWN